MSAGADFSTTIRRRLWRALALRRAPLWLAALLPVLAALFVGWRHGAPQPALAMAAVWLAWVLWDRRMLHASLEAQWMHWLDAAIPALEDSSVLLAQAPATPVGRLQRKRLEARIHDALRDRDVRAIAAARTGFRWLPLLASLLAAAACLAWQLRAAPDAAPVPARGVLPPPQAGELLLKVTPPAYTGVAPFETQARDIQVPQYSDVRWCFRRDGEPESVVELGDGKVLPLGAECARWQADESQFWRARHLPKNRYNIRVTPDQAPEVAVLAPTETVHVLAQDTQTVQIALSAKDDYGIARATLHLTGAGQRRKHPLLGQGNAVARVQRPACARLEKTVGAGGTGHGTGR
jgi:hypothetical protein